MALDKIKNTPKWVSFNIIKAYNLNYVNANGSQMTAEKCEELKLLHLYGRFETNTALEAYANVPLVEIESSYAPNKPVGFCVINDNQSRVHDFYIGTDCKIRFSDVTRIGGACNLDYDFIFRYA